MAFLDVAQELGVQVYLGNYNYSFSIFLRIY